MNDVRIVALFKWILDNAPSVSCIVFKHFLCSFTFIIEYEMKTEIASWQLAIIEIMREVLLHKRKDIIQDNSWWYYSVRIIFYPFFVIDINKDTIVPILIRSRFYNTMIAIRHLYSVFKTDLPFSCREWVHFRYRNNIQTRNWMCFSFITVWVINWPNVWKF